MQGLGPGPPVFPSVAGCVCYLRDVYIRSAVSTAMVGLVVSVFPDLLPGLSDTGASARP
jgi:hypothetical protein